MTEPDMIEGGEGDLPRKSSRVFVWAALAVVFLALVFLVAFRGPTLSHPKFLHNLTYRDKGWSKFPSAASPSHVQMFWIDESATVAEKEMDAQFKGKPSWMAAGFFPGYAYVPGTTKLQDAQMGLILSEGHLKDLHEFSSGLTGAGPGCTVIAVYMDKLSPWTRLRVWLFEGW